MSESPILITARVEATLTCRICGLSTPLNTLPTSGEVRCQRCRRAQAVDEDLAKELVAQIHAMADLAGEPGPYEYAKEGRPAKEEVDDVELAVRRSELECDVCSAPATWASVSPGVVEVRCTQCPATATYETKHANVARGLVGIVSIEERTDRNDVKLERNEAAVAILCPSCNAPLDAKAGSRLVTCQFCHTACRVPERSWSEIEGAAISEPWFLLFDKPSPDRAKIEAKRDAAERRKAVEAAWKARDEENAKAPRQSKPNAESKSDDRAFVNTATIAGLFLGFVPAVLLGVLFVPRLGDNVVYGAVALAVVCQGTNIALTGEGKPKNMPVARAKKLLRTMSILTGVCVTAILAAWVTW